MTVRQRADDVRRSPWTDRWRLVSACSERDHRCSCWVVCWAVCVVVCWLVHCVMDQPTPTPPRCHQLHQVLYHVQTIVCCRNCSDLGVWHVVCHLTMSQISTILQVCNACSVLPLITAPTFMIRYDMQVQLLSPISPKPAMLKTHLAWTSTALTPYNAYYLK